MDLNLIFESSTKHAPVVIVVYLLVKDLISAYLGKSRKRESSLSEVKAKITAVEAKVDLIVRLLKKEAYPVNGSNYDLRPYRRKLKKSLSEL